MKNKKLVIALVALVAVVAIVLGVYFATRPATSEGGKAVTVTVVHKDGSEKVFTYHTDEEYLGTVLVAEGLVEGEQSDYGLYIKAVDGETADYNTDGSYWAFYQGDAYAELGVTRPPSTTATASSWSILLPKAKIFPRFFRIGGIF